MPKAKPKGQKLTLDFVAKHLSDEGKAYEFVERQVMLGRTGYEGRGGG